MTRFKQMLVLGLLLFVITAVLPLRAEATSINWDNWSGWSQEAQTASTYK